MEKQIARAKELIQECIRFGILKSWDGKIKVFFVPEGKKEEEGGWVYMPLEEAAKDIVKQDVFDVLEKALEEKKKLFVDAETFKTDTEAYADLLKQAKEYALEHFPALHDTVFGKSDDFFLYYDGDFFTLYYFNPDSNCGGQIVECTFDDGMAKRVLDGESLMNVLAEREGYLYDINTISFFNTLRTLSDSSFDEKFIGNVETEDDLKALIEQVLKIKKLVQKN